MPFLKTLSLILVKIQRVGNYGAEVVEKDGSYPEIERALNQL